MISARDYSLLDRALQRLAFLSPTIQLTAADIERHTHGDRFRDITIEKPVFITSLPRAGTTLFLEIFSQIGSFASHRYRDMPFILAPMLWEDLVRHFRKRTSLKERAHGDGMIIDYDSPEAFEEVLWRAFWPEKYKRDRILLWRTDDKHLEFENFFVEHLKKIIAIRTENQLPRRYVSKNNANIARIDLLKRIFPDSVLLVPFRHPLSQAISMLRQHRNFLALHDREPFSRKYMQDIGHFEFGRLHRPISFDDEYDRTLSRYPNDTLEYWLAYWLAAFEHVLRHREKVILLSYERACEHNIEALEAMGERLGIECDNLSSLAKAFRPPRKYPTDTKVHDERLVERAHAVHERLLNTSII